LTGTLQNYARRRSIPIDLIAFNHTVVPEARARSLVTPPPDGEGCYITGLFIDGARWNNQTNVCNAPSGVQALGGTGLWNRGSGGEEGGGGRCCIKGRGKAKLHGHGFAHGKWIVFCDGGSNHGMCSYSMNRFRES